MGKFSDLLNGNELVLVDFYADWCGPCKTMNPIIQKVAKEHRGKVRVVKVNVDKNQYASQKYGVRNIPTLILFHRKKAIWKGIGVKTEQEINAAIAQHS